MGHENLITKTLYKNHFPKFLQSYEFALVSQTFLDYTRINPEVQLLNHAHD